MDCRIRRGENRVPLLGRRGYYPKRPARRASGYPAPPARFVRRVYPPGGRNGHRRQGDLRSPRALRRAVAILRVRRRLPRPETELEAARITTATPGTGATCGHPWAPSRDTLPCPLSCPICPARWTPCPWARPRSPCSIRAVRQGAVQRWAMSDTGGWDLLTYPGQRPRGRGAPIAA
jgi:hypothetical protein